ncbi:MAG: hypothetical protein WC951_07330 [Bacteroidales bacterium]|nr:hypothetical protein [Tenuifilaceae bacterium]
MFQDILALLTVAGAIVYMVWGVYKTVAPNKNQQNSMCNGCYAAGCSVKTVKQKSNEYS